MTVTYRISVVTGSKAEKDTFPPRVWRKIEAARDSKKLRAQAIAEFGQAILAHPPVSPDPWVTPKALLEFTDSQGHSMVLCRGRPDGGRWDTANP
jgi:hypothetical protein